MTLRLEVCKVPKPVVTTWLQHIRNPAYPILPEGHYVSTGESTYIDGELTELHLYHSPDGNCYLTVDPRN